MKKRFLNNEENSAAKAAVYYLLCQFLVNGIAFITTPIFARLLTKTEYGTVTNFMAWEALLLPILTLNLRNSINKSKYDFDKDNDSFLSSILLLSHVLILFVYVLCEVFQEKVQGLLSLDMRCIRLLFAYMFFYVAFDFQQIQFNIYRKYKLFVFYSVIQSFGSICLSVVLVNILPEKLIGRLLGFVIPAIIIDSFIILSIWKRGKCFNWKYIRYALGISVPLIPHALSGTILSSSDRIIITHSCGAEAAAMYAIAYTVSSIASVIWMALNQAWGPWLFDNLRDKNYSKIKDVSKRFALLYSFIIVGIMLFAPEVLYVLGGKEYLHALSAMPPVILAMVCQFFYAFYFNVEYFYGETAVISIGTLLAAVTNIILNLIFVPVYGYVAAAYTTLVGYFILLL
nr:oligosaccharide flippase family protein [Treponemataceae bacterium]